MTLYSRFGFRYWRDPGPWAGADPSNRLMSFVNAVNVAAFCMGGPEYISSKQAATRNVSWLISCSDRWRIKRPSSHRTTGIQHYYDSSYCLLYRWLSLRWSK